jgi:DNA-binding PadR family transcriptional regulator
VAENADAAPMQSSVNWALLGLVIERPSYGYDLAQRFERAYGGMLHLSGASYIYTGLKALERRSLVEGVSGKGGERQPKPRYEATPQGMRAYRERLISEVQEERRRLRLFARQLAVFAREPQVALEIIRSSRRALLEEAARAPLSSGNAPRDAVSGLAKRLEGEASRLAMDTKLLWLDYASREFGALATEELPRR